MCCHRDHYPTTVGIHQVDSSSLHTHLVLPWAKLNHVVCLSAHSPTITLVWRDFNGYQWPSASANVYTDDVQTVNDLLVVAIAESGKCGHDFFKNLIRRYNRDRRSSGLVVSYSDANGFLEFNPPPPEEIEEWHEWLVKVAKTEVDDYQRRLVMEKALHDAHPELGV